MRRPLVKVCGVTRPEDGVRAVELGAALVGLNFHPPSPRSVEPARAAEIAAAVRRRAAEVGGEPVRVVGVFVNRSREEMQAVDREVGLDLLQLHGDETPEEVAPFAGRALVVTRVPPTDPPSAAALQARLAAFGNVWGYLFDVRHGELYGGTGESFGWRLLAGLDRRRLGERPVLVAGGIGPGNAARALAESGADGVDVASGVEASPGIKDRQTLERLFVEVRRHGESQHPSR